MSESQPIAENDAPPLRVEIVQRDGQPATCKVWRGDVLVFDGVDRSVLLSVIPPGKERSL